MPIANGIREALGSASLIRKMFEEGNRLKKQHGPEKVFDFSLGNPDVEPPPDFHRALRRLAAEDKKGSHGYMPNSGYEETRNALAAKVSQDQGVRLDGSCVVMSCGAAGGLNVVFKALLNPDDEVVVPSPYFMEYRAYAANHGARLVPAATLPDFSLDLGSIEAALSARTGAVLINSPHNPTGRVYPSAVIAGLARILEAHGKRLGRFPYLIADEPYREIAYVPVPPVLAAYRESLAVSSYSKSLSLPGERIGYIGVHPEIRDKEEVLGALAYATRTLGFVNAPALMQRIVAELTDAAVDVGVYARRRDCFKQVLDCAGITYAEPEGAFYLFCQVPSGGDDRAFVSHLKSHLILGVPGSGFGASGWVRFAYCVDENVIKSSAPAFKKALDSWQP
ncbi:MAG: pyridoxal phosphate-dependent aminotransferase [Spirochaetaceae bacterium]|jgi:aspartate aminotransferase|nr:pyridoxal phosphate-dependent aminotransferase [Spirochaetaceae bacterium]